ncbi:MAG: hypothetical protein OEX77_08925 [Candidatus Bathyarchaeota archaeon]|nr:hypothetical protein [Candidatus Bathyarchaeota archaeon]
MGLKFQLQKYTQLIDFEGDEYTSKATKDAEEAKQLVETGFEYACTTPDAIMLFPNASDH